MTALSLKAAMLSAAIATVASGPFLLVSPVSAGMSGASDDSFHDYSDDEPCMTDHRMRQFLAAKGYTNIKLNIPNGSRWQAKASLNGGVYLVVVDTCSASIINRGQI